MRCRRLCGVGGRGTAGLSGISRCAAREVNPERDRSSRCGIQNLLILGGCEVAASKERETRRKILWFKSRILCCASGPTRSCRCTQTKRCKRCVEPGTRKKCDILRGTGYGLICEFNLSAQPCRSNFGSTPLLPDHVKLLKILLRVCIMWVDTQRLPELFNRIGDVLFDKKRNS